LYRSTTVKLINALVTSSKESIEQERVLNQQITTLLDVCTQLAQGQVIRQTEAAVGVFGTINKENILFAIFLHWRNGWCERHDPLFRQRAG